MSKKDLKKLAKLNRVTAVPTKSITNKKGEIVKQFYDLYRV